MWEIVSNREAISVNQQWAGHPGWRLKSWTPPHVKQLPGDSDHNVGDGVSWDGPLDAMSVWVKPQPAGDWFLDARKPHALGCALREFPLPNP